MTSKKKHIVQMRCLDEGHYSLPVKLYSSVFNEVEWSDEINKKQRVLVLLAVTVETHFECSRPKWREKDAF